MITKEDLDRLKFLYQGATIGPLVVAAMDSRGQWYQLQTPKTGGGIILGTWLRKGNAEYMAAAWEWLPKLINLIEDLGWMASVLESGDDSADVPSRAERALHEHGEGVPSFGGTEAVAPQAPAATRSPRFRRLRARQAQQARRVSGDQ